MNSVQTAYDGAVARITLAQPDLRNAFNDETIAALTAAFAQAGARDDVRAVVLAAQGTAFCAGADLNWMRRMADYTREENVADAGALAEMLRTIYECPKPTIARVQGDVYAGGMGLVAACDMAVAVDTAGFCLSEVKLGLIPATISPYVIRAMGARRPPLFPDRRALRRGRALHLGFVHAVVEFEQARRHGGCLAQGAHQRQPGRGARLQAAGAGRGGPRHRCRAHCRHGAGDCRHPRQRRGA